MALVNFNMNSKYLGGNTEVTIILPDRPWGDEPEKFYRSGRKYKVLWLLHGTFGDHTDWLRKSNIELYATEKESGRRLCICVKLQLFQLDYRHDGLQHVRFHDQGADACDVWMVSDL